MKKFTYWRADATPIFHEPRWSVGQWGPRYIVQCTEEDVQVMVDALNQQLENKGE